MHTRLALLIVIVHVGKLEKALGAANTPLLRPGSARRGSSPSQNSSSAAGGRSSPKPKPAKRNSLKHVAIMIDSPAQVATLAPFISNNNNKLKRFPARARCAWSKSELSRQTCSERHAILYLTMMKMTCSLLHLFARTAISYITKYSEDTAIPCQNQETIHSLFDGTAGATNDVILLSRLHWTPLLTLQELKDSFSRSCNKHLIP